MAFIIPTQKVLIIETNGLQFGSANSQISATFDLDQSVVTLTPNVTVTLPTGAPFTASVINSNTPKPKIVFSLTGDQSAFALGTNYSITVTANGQTDNFDVQFLLSQNFDPTAWSNSNSEDSLGGYFLLSQIALGAPVLSTLVNSKLRSIFEFIGLVYFKTVDLVNRFRIKHNLADIVNAAIYIGSIPAGYTGVINYANDGTTNISNIILTDTIGDTDSFTKIIFNYANVTETITNNNVTPPVATTKTYAALNSISINRVSDSTGSTIQYVIASIQVSRANVTFTSVIDPGYSVTMPMINGWTVTE